MADDALIARITRAYRACDRVLSGRSMATMADQLAALSDTGYDLDRFPDIYGDGIVADLEARVAALLGKPAAAFFPSGTMAQQIALRAWSDRAGNPTVATHPLHHLEMYERHAFTTLSGLRAVWPTSEHRHPSAAEIRATDEPFATLCIELPMRAAGFTLPTWDELTGMVEAARERDAYVHIDGARLWESVPHLGHDLPAIAALADSVYVSFYKTIGGLAGAALAGPQDFIATTKAWRHRYGGQIATQWPSALSALRGLDRVLPELASYVEHAKVVASALATLPGAVVNPNPPHTHQFEFWLPYPEKVLNEATLALAEQEKVRFIGGWWGRPPGDRTMAEVTITAGALAWTATDVIEVGTAFLERAATIAAAG